MSKKNEKFKGNEPGFGAVFYNDYKEEESHPDYKGKLAFDDDLLEIAGEDGELEIALWKRKDKNEKTYLSIKVQEVYKRDEGAKIKKKKKEVDLDDEDDDL